MFIVQIEHPVPSFDGWKQVFDDDPLNRKESGVRRHRIFRPIDDPQCAVVDLEFDTSSEAEAFLARLRHLWQSVEGTIMENPRGRIVEIVEGQDY